MHRHPILRRRRVSVAAAVCAVALSLTACSGGSGASDSTSSKKPIVIGIAAGFTGFLSVYDGPVRNAIEYEAKQVNAKGGIDGRQVKIVTADMKSNVDQSASAALDVIDKGADVVVTACDYDFGSPAAVVAQKAGKLALSCAGSALFGSIGVGNLAYSINESSATGASVAAQFAIDKGWKSSYLLDDTSIQFSSSWCSAFKQAYSKLGGTVLGEDTFAQSDTSIQSQISALSALKTKPATIAVCSYPPTGGVAVGQLRDAGFDQPIVTTSAFDGPGWLKSAPDVSNVYIAASASIFGDDPSADVNGLVKDYTAAYSAPQSSYFAFGSQIAQTIFTAIKQAHSTEGSKLATALDKWKDQSTLLGPTTYTPTCHSALGRPMRVLQYQHGKGSYVKTVTASVRIVPDGYKE